MDVYTNITQSMFSRCMKINSTCSAVVNSIQERGALFQSKFAIVYNIFGSFYSLTSPKRVQMTLKFQQETF